MKLPFVSRRFHEETCARYLEGLQAVNEAHDNLVAQYQNELELVRQDRIAAQNESASLRGQLVAERHARGEPA